MAAANLDGKELDKKIRHAKLIQKLNDHIPRTSKVFETLLAGITSVVSPLEISECEQGNFRKVAEILERHGLFDVGKYQFIRSVFNEGNEKLVIFINKCENDINRLNGKDLSDDDHDEDDDDDDGDTNGFTEVRGKLSQDRKPKFEAEEESCMSSRNKEDLNIYLRTESKNQCITFTCTSTEEEADSDKFAIKTVEKCEEPANQVLHKRSIHTCLEEEGSSHRLAQKTDTPYLDRLPGSYITNRQRTNFAKLSRAIIDLSADVLRNILHKLCHPTKVLKKLQPQINKVTVIPFDKIKEAIHTRSYQNFDIPVLYSMLKMLSVQQLRDSLMAIGNLEQLYDKVESCFALYSKLSAEEISYIKAVTLESFENIEYELLCKLYNHLCATSEDIIIKNSKWNNKPDPNHLDLGDDIERLRILRNIVVHGTVTEIPDCEFRAHWKDLESVMTRMDERFKTNYKADLDIILCDYYVNPEEIQILRTGKEKVAELEQKTEKKDENRTNEETLPNETVAKLEEEKTEKKDDCTSYLRHQRIDSLDSNGDSICNMSMNIKYVKGRELKKYVELYVLVPVSYVVWLLKHLVMVFVTMVVLFYLFRS